MAFNQFVLLVVDFLHDLYCIFIFVYNFNHSLIT